MSEAVPGLSVILVTPHGTAHLRATLEDLRRQTARERIELVLVGPSEASFDDLDAAAMAEFAGCTTLAAGPIRECERALAAGVAMARAPLVALLENHVFPDPDWAAAILRAHEGPWVAVGSAIDNANPESVTSWVEHFLSYGFHDSSVPGGETSRISRNNLTVKRAALESIGLEHLGDVMARDGSLLGELRRGGGRFFREPQARLRHLNVSRMSSLAWLRLHSARASAATRARLERFSVARRWLYVVSSPIFPLLRLRALWPRLRSHAERRRFKSFWPIMVVAATVDALGQAAGFALGAGHSAERAAGFDLDRIPHLSAADQRRFAESSSA